MNTAEAPFGAWIDARHAASEESMKNGYAWITGSQHAGYSVISSGSIEDAPEESAAEFIEGVQQ